MHFIVLVVTIDGRFHSTLAHTFLSAIFWISLLSQAILVHSKPLLGKIYPHKFCFCGTKEYELSNKNSLFSLNHARVTSLQNLKPIVAQH